MATSGHEAAERILAELVDESIPQELLEFMGKHER
jgi:hypothetical protein